MTATPSNVRAWEPEIAGIREVLHAVDFDHCYPSHIHDTWTVFVVDAGSIQFRLGGIDRSVAAGAVTILPPGVPHDGRPGGQRGFNKRVLYVETTLVPESLVGMAVDAPTIKDADLCSAVGRLHQLLHTEDRERCEDLTKLIAARIRDRLSGSTAALPPRRRSEVAEAYRDLLDDNLFGRFRLAEAAALLGVNPTHLVRSFTAEFGISPNRYKTSRRLDAARRRVLRGESLADIAHDLGYADQSHMTRSFKSLIGIPPGRLAARRPTRNFFKTGSSPAG